MLASSPEHTGLFWANRTTGDLMSPALRMDGWINGGMDGWMNGFVTVRAAWDARAVTTHAKRCMKIQVCAVMKMAAGEWH